MSVQSGSLGSLRGGARVVVLDDRELLGEFGRRNPFLHVYELGDLDDFFWPRTTWYGLEVHATLQQVVLVYDEPAPPVLVALADPPSELMAELVARLVPRLPPRVYAHLSPGVLEALRARYTAGIPQRHLKLGLLHAGRLAGQTAAEPRVLGAADLGEVEAFYRDAYPGTWFQPRMLESGCYLGLDDADGLACIAGVHVYSPTWRVAALGNVATHPRARGRGLATRACASLCRRLLDDGIDVIGLNVHSENAAALAVYRRLGFEPVAEYVEVALTAG